MGRPTITCLLPARNAAAELDGWLESVARFADSVIALDDGSTDDTAERLGAHPLVRRLLRNPERPTYEGWDDAANRQRLLDAAIEDGADWVVYLDADERIDADDAQALRAFVDADALPGCAYGFLLHREWGSDRVAMPPSWVYRMFAPEPGQRLGGESLHFNPIPDSISPGARVRTTLRLRHLDSPARLRERTAKYAEVDPGADPDFGTPALQHEPDGEVVPWGPRPSGLGVLAPWEGTTVPAAAGAEGPTITCLLPARNAAAELDGWLESVARFADSVIALDDGSTDDTAERLGAHPLVRRLLRNPERPTYEGWDDAANRQRLLDAAIEDGADWVVYLDADERIDADDAQALRAFATDEAEPGHAYGFRVFRMSEDGSSYDRAALWAYRMFAPEEGQSLPQPRLHLVPVPVSIDRGLWERTTIRIQHFAGATAERRSSRFAKYREADPAHEHQREYASLLEPRVAERAWQPRPAGLPALADPLGVGSPIDLEALDLDAPALSAIVISRNDERTIARSVASVMAQEVDERFEVIVVTSGADRTAEIVRDRYPEAILVELARPALPGAARNAGLARARGDYVSFPGSHVELVPGSLAARLRAHRQGHPIVTGSALNGTRTHAGWAAYFLDHSSSLPGRPSGELAGPPARCSYERELLVEVGGFPEGLRAGEDTIVNNELWMRGHRAYRAADVSFIHHSPSRTPWRLLRHHFGRGRAHGRMMVSASAGRPLPRRQAPALAAGYARARARQTSRRVSMWADPELAARYRRARPLVLLGVVAAAAGTCFEVIGPRRPAD